MNRSSAPNQIDDGRHRHDRTAAPSLTVELDATLWQFGPGDEVTFGRDADIVVDPSNLSLHRVLGRLRCADGRWHLANVGRTVSLVASDTDGASFARIAPGTDMPLPFPRTTVKFSAGRANYRLTIEVDPASWVVDSNATSPTQPTSVERTLTASGLVFNEEQFELLCALAAPRLDGPITSADLPSNRQLARQLGWSPAKLTRKLDHLCAKFARVGVNGLVGSTAGTATERRLLLADLAVEHRIVARPGGGTR